MVQDLAVVVLLMLIPLLAPNESGAPFGLATISKALGLAAIKVQVPSSFSQRIRTLACEKLTRGLLLQYHLCKSSRSDNIRHSIELFCRGSLLTEHR